MPKKLSKRIAERVKSNQNTRRNSKPVFLAVLEEIREALKDGWSMKIIWDTLRTEGKIDFSYGTFISYVRQLIHNLPSRANLSSEAGKVVPHTPVTSEPSHKDKPIASKKSSTIPGFTFNPRADDKDLF